MESGGALWKLSKHSRHQTESYGTLWTNTARTLNQWVEGSSPPRLTHQKGRKYGKTAAGAAS